MPNLWRRKGRQEGTFEDDDPPNNKRGTLKRMEHSNKRLGGKEPLERSGSAEESLNQAFFADLKKGRRPEDRTY